MESSVSSLTSESTPKDKKNPFKKLSCKVNNQKHNFEVSLSESTFTETNVNKSDEILDSGSAVSKVAPFKKPKNVVQETFNVTLQNSVTESEFEKTSVSSNFLFSKKKKLEKDYFNVSYDETNLSYTETDGLTKNNDSSTGEKSIVNKKSLLFKKKLNHTKESEISLDQYSYNDDNLNHWMSDNSDQSDEELHHSPSIPSMLSNTLKTNEKLDEVKGDPPTNTMEIPKTWTSENSSFSDEVMHPPSVPSILSNTLKTNDKLQEKTKDDTCANTIDSLKNWMSDNSDLIDEDVHSPSVPAIPSNTSKISEKLQEDTKGGLPTSTNVLESWEQKFNKIISNSKKVNKEKNPQHNSPKINIEEKDKKTFPKKTTQSENKFKPPKLRKQASFSSKRLHQFISKKLQPKFGIDTLIETEELVFLICDTVNKVTRRKNYQKNLIQQLKNKMISTGLIKTTVDFYEFVIKFLPYSFRVKVVPCVQPVTNNVFPPKDFSNPFDKLC